MQWVISLLLFYSVTCSANDPVVFKETNGLVAIEAEHYSSQHKTNFRAWYHISNNNKPFVNPDPDPPHISGASNGEYIEILPDTRYTHEDSLQPGKNFSNDAGEMGVISYFVDFESTGKYYIWVRLFSSSTEDNGIHVGIDDLWPSSGNRMQWCKGKNKWTWDSKQRTNKNHCGEPYLIYLIIKNQGVHKISFSMREDGAEFDKWLMTTDNNFIPNGFGPDEAMISEGGDSKI